MKIKTGIEHQGIAAPLYTGLRMTIPVREALEREGNFVYVKDDGLWAVSLEGKIPEGLHLVLIGHGRDQCQGLRLDNEPPYPDEWGPEGVAWYELGAWVPCPTCKAPLVWYEAGYVPGYRVCAHKPYHHAMLSMDGSTAKPVPR